MRGHTGNVVEDSLVTKEAPLASQVQTGPWWDQTHFLLSASLPHPLKSDSRGDGNQCSHCFVVSRHVTPGLEKVS